jgi:hypothetical protein
MPIVTEDSQPKRRRAPWWVLTSLLALLLALICNRALGSWPKSAYVLAPHQWGFGVDTLYIHTTPVNRVHRIGVVAWEEPISYRIPVIVSPLER